MERYNHYSWAAFPLLIGLAALINWALTPLPAPQDLTADSQRFSAARAARHLDTVAAAPHPMGSSALAEVRTYLLGELRALGFDAQIDAYVAHSARPGTFSLAHIQNVSARLPGTRGAGKALLLMSHYDSVPQSFGAGDDGLGTSTILEVARAIAAGPRPANDILIVFTDGEESGLWGARAFFEQDPRADEIGFVINLESRGSQGPAILFETSAPNGGVINALAPVLKSPVTSSISQAVYQLAPNSTDFTPALRRGLQGINFANLDGFYDYHSHTDRKDYLSPATLQHMGDQVLAVAQHLSNADLPLTGGADTAYHGGWGLPLVPIPLWLGWVLLGACGLGYAALLRVDLQAGAVRPSDVFKALAFPLQLLFVFVLLILSVEYVGGASPFTDPVEFRRVAAWGDMKALGLVVLMLVLAVFWVGTILDGKGRHQLKLGLLFSVMTFADTPLPWFVPLIMAGLVAGSSFLYRRPLSAGALRMGALGFFLMLALAVQAFLPLGSYLFILPLLLSVLGCALAGRALEGESPLRAYLVYAAVVLVGVVALVNFARLLHLGLGVYFSVVLVLPVLLLTLTCAPLISRMDATPWHRPMIASVAIAAMMLVWSLFLGGFSDRHPRPVDLMYLVDDRASTSHFASRDADTPPWFAQMLGHAPEPLGLDFPIFGRALPLWGGAAPPSPPDFGSATAEIVDMHKTSEGAQHARLRLHPRRAGDAVLFHIGDTTGLMQVRVNGKDAALSVDGDGFSVISLATPEGGIEVEIMTALEADLPPAQFLSITATLPAGIAAALPARPADMMPASGYGRIGAFGTVWMGEVRF